MPKLIAVAASALCDLGQEALSALVLGKGFAHLAFALEVGLRRTCRPKTSGPTFVLKSLPGLQVAHQCGLHGWRLLDKVFKLRLEGLHRHGIRVILGQHGIQVLRGDLIIFHHKR